MYLSHFSAQRRLILIVRDSGGKTASCSFVLYVDLTPKDEASTTHKFTFILSESPQFTNNSTLLASFGRKLAGAMSKSDKMPGDLVMIQTGINKGGLRFVEWFDLSMTGSAWCKADEIRNAATLMVGNEAMEGRNKPKKEFASKFRPEFKLKAIVIQFYGPCKNFITTTTPTTTTTTTTTTPTTIAHTKATEDTTVSASSHNTTQSTDSSDNSTDEGSNEKNATAPYPVTVLEKQLPEIVTETGMPLRYIIPSKIFSDINTLGSKLQIALMEPEAWVAVDSDSHTLYLMPTRADVLQLHEHNSSYKMWHGSLSVTNMDGVKVAMIDLKVLIKREIDDAKKPNHKFVVVLKDYNLKVSQIYHRCG